MANTKPLPYAIFLMGPTAAGKTAMAFELAKQLPVEIISVDSAMVYRGMDIGTGKPNNEELKRVPHHLIDIKDPSQAYSAAEFASDALSLMQEVTNRNRIPLLVGGTMFYFRALKQGLSSLPPADPEVRIRIAQEADKIGWAAMHEKLAIVDPQAAKRIHPNDPQRIQRALEVYAISHKPLSFHFTEVSSQRNASQNIRSIEDYQINAFAIVPPDRSVLHQHIETRFHEMLAQGLVEEVEHLFKRPDLNTHLPSIRSVGYRQVWSYLQGEYPYEEMVKRAIIATRQLAKRQLTWIRSMPEIILLENIHLGSIKTVVNSIAYTGV